MEKIKKVEELAEILKPFAAGIRKWSGKRI